MGRTSFCPPTPGDPTHLRPRSLPGASDAPGSAPPLRPGIASHNRQGSITRGSRSRDQGAAGGRRALRPPDAPLEPQDAPLHLRRARRHLHHRPAADRAAARPGAALRRRPRAPRRHRAVRRHQEAGPRRHQGDRRGGRPAVRQPPLARRPADELPDDLRADQAPARPRALRDRGPAGAAADARADGRPGRPREAAREPRRRQEHAARPRRAVRDRPQDRGDRGPRGPAPADPDHRPGRHQLRPGRHRLRDPGQRRRDPRLQRHHARRSAT